MGQLLKPREEHGVILGGELRFAQFLNIAADVAVVDDGGGGVRVDGWLYEATNGEVLRLADHLRFFDDPAPVLPNAYT